LKDHAVWQVCQGILADRPFGLELGDDASRECERIDENAAQQHAAIDHDQDGHQQVDEIAVPAEADGGTEKDRRGVSDGRHRNRGEGECAARQHPGAKAGDHQLCAAGRIGEESHRDYSPGGPENECVSHQPVHGPAGYELRLCDPPR